MLQLTMATSNKQGQCWRWWLSIKTREEKSHFNQPDPLYAIFMNRFYYSLQPFYHLNNYSVQKNMYVVMECNNLTFIISAITEYKCLIFNISEFIFLIFQESCARMQHFKYRSQFMLEKLGHCEWKIIGRKLIVWLHCCSQSHRIRKMKTRDFYSELIINRYI